ncbi:MAG: hypothetical protein WCI22_15415, partial [Actinomycetota bacterium]
MSTLHITLSAHRCTFDIDGQSLVVPFGRITLDSAIASDPPRPEELINAIGSVLDHLEDVDRELPAIVSMDQAALSGDGVDVLAAVEVGTSTPLPYRL